MSHPIPMLLAASETSDAAWRREILAMQVELLAREQQRSRFLGQLLFVAATVLFGVLCYWAAHGLGIDVLMDVATLDKTSTLVFFGVATVLLGSLLFIWDARVRLVQSELRLLERALNLQRGREGPAE